MVYLTQIANRLSFKHIIYPKNFNEIFYMFFVLQNLQNPVYILPLLHISFQSQFSGLKSHI